MIMIIVLISKLETFSRTITLKLIYIIIAIIITLIIVPILPPVSKISIYLFINFIICLNLFLCRHLKINSLSLFNS